MSSGSLDTAPAAATTNVVVIVTETGSAWHGRFANVNGWGEELDLNDYKGKDQYKLHYILNLLDTASTLEQESDGQDVPCQDAIDQEVPEHPINPGTETVEVEPEEEEPEDEESIVSEPVPATCLS